jgi:IclR family KDG regulon transcriptional repressor
MTEQYVQHSVQQASSQSTEPLASGAASPMVERAFRLLELLSVSEEGLTLSEIARALGMSKSSVHGLLKTLENNRVIEQSEERRYLLGPRIFDLAQTYGQRPNLRRFALPAMRRLAARIGQAVFLGRVEQDRIRILECVEDEGERPALSISARRGARIPLMAGATARVVLASWPAAKREAFLQVTPLPHFTEQSITDPMQLLAAAEETARTGIGYDYGEYLTGVNAVAVPILGPGNALVALLWIAGFASHFGAEAMRSAGQELRAEAETISRSLGAR